MRWVAEQPSARPNVMCASFRFFLSTFLLFLPTLQGAAVTARPCIRRTGPLSGSSTAAGDFCESGPPPHVDLGGDTSTPTHLARKSVTLVVVERPRQRSAYSERRSGPLPAGTSRAPTAWSPRRYRLPMSTPKTDTTNGERGRSPIWKSGVPHEYGSLVCHGVSDSTREYRTECTRRRRTPGTRTSVEVFRCRRGCRTVRRPRRQRSQRRRNRS